MAEEPQALSMRMAGDDDLDAVVAVCGEALGWTDSHPNEAFFRWKHFENPFGRSPIWLSLDGDRIVGVRTMMRWTFVNPAGQRLAMVRAVDTATLPAYQGRGIFRSLTLRAVEDLTAQGVDAVFNTPNEKSRPGYLKMGWSQLGQVAIAGRPRGPASLVRMARSRIAADRWGEPVAAGLDPGEAFADRAALGAALERAEIPKGWATDRTVEYLTWRLGFAPLHYRVAPIGATVADGFVGFRVRQRGAMREMSINEVVVPPGSAGAVRALIGRLLRATNSDVALTTAATAGLSAGLFPLPRLGPILTWRPLATAAVPALGELDLSLATVELF